MKLKFIILTIIGLFSFSSFAQEEISPERKQAIDSLALEKVKDLSKYISIIGNKETSFSEANRVIERTLELFANNSQIGVSSLYRKEVKYYPVRKYLNRLMALNYDRSTLGPFLASLAGYQALRYIEAGRASVLGSSKGLFVLIGAFFYFGTLPQAHQIWGGLISILGVVLISMGKVWSSKKTKKASKFL